MTILVPALRIEGLSVFRDDTPVVRDASFTIAPGEALGVLGHNGAGKTTLIEGIVGLLRSQGDITHDGQSLTSFPAATRARAGIALVPQGRRLIPGMTVEENLATARLAPSGHGPAVDVHELFPALAEHGKRRAGLLSGGQQQQVAVARALLRRPTLLVLDEPTEGLAPIVIREITDALVRLRSLGVSILLAEQHHHVVAAVCDRYAIVRSGRITEQGIADGNTLAGYGQQL